MVIHVLSTEHPKAAGSRIAPVITAVALAIFALPPAVARADTACGGDADHAPLSIAQRLFYNGDYQQAAALTDGSCGAAESLAACELRSSALLFDIKRAMGDGGSKDKRFTQCPRCQQLMPQFLADNVRGLRTARAWLEANGDDQATRFLLAKLDLNYVWLQLGILGRKTGWGEYWEARRSLDKVLSADPGHLRARVARAWIDYIVDTRLPLGTRWLLGGGDKKRGLLTLKQAATAEGGFFARAEAGFALWDVQLREKQTADAVATARRLICDFPDNQELRRFLQTHTTVN